MINHRRDEHYLLPRVGDKACSKCIVTAVIESAISSLLALTKATSLKRYQLQGKLQRVQ